MPVLMAVDPGPHIGVAIKIESPTTSTPLVSYQTATLTDANELYRMIREFKPDRVAVETFFTGNRVDVHMIHTIEQVGGVRAACAVLDIECYGQVPGARVSFIEEAKDLMRKEGRVLDLSKQGDDHEIQALAHLLLMDHRIKNKTLRDQGKWRTKA